jgi:hypothetical protein
MERRNFLELTFAFAAVAALAVSVQAAPLSPHPLVESGKVSSTGIADPAVTSRDEVDSLKPLEARWGHHWHHHGHWGWHRGWHHRHWGWRHRHWGWRHHHWHHRHYW